MTERARREHILPLTSLRGLAAVMIMLFHVRYAFREIQPFNYWIFEFKIFNKGYLWVDFFFLLSGYLLSMRYFTGDGISNKEYGRFITQRFRRIFPVSIMMTMVFVLATGFIKNWSFVTDNFTSIVANLTLTHAWGFYFAKDWNSPSWSLSAEWGAYVLFPILVYFERITGDFVQKIFLSFGLWGFLFWISATYHNYSLDLTTHHGLWKCLIEVTLGILASKIGDGFEEFFAQESISMEKSWDFLAAFTFLGILVHLYVGAPDILMVPLAGGLITFSAKARGTWKMVMSHYVPVFLGKISFSIFMVHAFVCFLFENSYKYWVAEPLSIGYGTFLFFLVVGVVIGLSCLSYYLVEEYFMGQRTYDLPSQEEEAA